MMTPKTIVDRYDIQTKIGAGGMADVYLATDRRLGRRVAVKVLRADTAADATFVERFRREAHAAAALNHPNIVSVYDWGETDDTYFMVMEYVPGKDLKELLRERGTLPEAEALFVAAQIAGALHEAHEQGIVHRDIKPQNVLIGMDGVVKVADFGIARAVGLSQLTTIDAVCGTAQYLSPEQAQRQALDGRSDVYSLGVVLFEMLTGRELFTGHSALEVALQHIQREPDSPRSARRDLSDGSETLVLRALAKDPSDRYQSSAEMAVALRAAGERIDRPAVGVTAPFPIVETALPAPESGRRQPAVEPPRGRTIGRVIVSEPRPAKGSQSPPGSKSRRTYHGRRWIMSAPLLVLALIAGSALAMSRSGKDSGHSPVGLVATRHSPTAVARRPTVVSGRHGSTSVARPSSASSAQRPAATASAAPTVRPQSTPTALPTTPPADTSLARTGDGSVGQSAPVIAVRNFYALVSAHNFAGATSYWNAAMKAAYDPSVNINRRFAGTSSITVQQAELTQFDRVLGSAAVAVHLVETRADGTTVQLRGTWYLRRGTSGWKLDSVAF